MPERSLRFVQILSGLGIVLGVGVLYTAWGSLPIVSAPMVACAQIPAGRPELAADWTINYYNSCHARDDAHLLLVALTAVAGLLLTNSYLLLRSGATDGTS